MTSAKNRTKSSAAQLEVSQLEVSQRAQRVKAVESQAGKASAKARGAIESLREDVSCEECRRVLQNLSLFASLSDADVEQFAPLARVRELCAGSTVFYEDADADAMYFLCEGAIEVFKSDEAGKKLPLAILRDGGVLGEMGLLTRDARSATARTLTRTRLLMVASADFHRALEDGNLAAHRLVFGLARVLAERLNTVNRTLFALHQTETDAATAR